MLKEILVSFHGVSGEFSIFQKNFRESQGRFKGILTVYRLFRRFSVCCSRVLGGSSRFLRFREHPGLLWNASERVLNPLKQAETLWNPSGSLWESSKLCETSWNLTVTLWNVHKPLRNVPIMYLKLSETTVTFFISPKNPSNPSVPAPLNSWKSFWSYLVLRTKYALAYIKPLQFMEPIALKEVPV